MTKNPSDTNLIYHNARITLFVRIPDGVYVPEEFQLDEESIKQAEQEFGIHSTSMCRAIEINDNLINVLEGMGVDVEGSAISDVYEVSE
jgi:hypothetical protein